MTNKEWFRATTANFNMDESQVQLIMVNQGIDPEGVIDNVRDLKAALCREVAVMLPLANVTEGGYSVSWNVEMVKLWYNTMCKELGITNTLKPKVTIVNVW